jgi:hypothetical protein
MKRHSLIVAVLIVIMAISTLVLAGEGRRDSRDLGYLDQNPAVSISNHQPSQPQMINDRKDARDLSYLTSSTVSPVLSCHKIAMMNDRRDARDLAYLFGNSETYTVCPPTNAVINCCQR